MEKYNVLGTESLKTAVKSLGKVRDEKILNELDFDKEKPTLKRNLFVEENANRSRGGKFTTEVKKKDPNNLLSKSKILVMDDDVFILKMLTTILKRLNCQVVTTEDGEEAISKFKEAYLGQDPFDFVILDLMVPNGMGGQATMIELQKINREVKAIISSGNSNDVTISEYKKFGFKNALKKPYGLDKLVECLINQRN